MNWSPTNYPRLKIDRRIKVKSDLAKTWCDLRAKGLSYRKIANLFGVAKMTVQYHVDPKFREKVLQKKRVRLKNADPKTRARYNGYKRKYSKLNDALRRRTDDIYREWKLAIDRKYNKNVRIAAPCMTAKQGIV